MATLPGRLLTAAEGLSVSEPVDSYFGPNEDGGDDRNYVDDDDDFDPYFVLYKEDDA